MAHLELADREDLLRGALKAFSGRGLPHAFSGLSALEIRDLYTANFVFLFKSRVPNELIPINPLGLTITYFREDEAFK